MYASTEVQTKAEWIDLHTIKCVIIQFVLIFTTLHLYTYFLFSTPAFCLEKITLVVSKCSIQFWQDLYIPLTILAIWVRFPTFVLLHCKSRRCQFGPSKIILKPNFLVKRQTFLCMLLVPKVPICVNSHKQCIIHIWLQIQSDRLNRDDTELILDPDSEGDFWLWPLW